MSEAHVHTVREVPSRFVDRDGKPEFGYQRFKCRGCKAEWLVRPGERPSVELQNLLSRQQ